MLLVWVDHGSTWSALITLPVALWEVSLGVWLVVKELNLCRTISAIVELDQGPTRCSGIGGRWFASTTRGAHRADRCDGHLPGTMRPESWPPDGRVGRRPAATCPVDAEEKGCASQAVDRQRAGDWTLLQPSLFAENRSSREGGVIARWWEEDGIEREPCRDDGTLPCASVPDGEQDERCRCPPRPRAPWVRVSGEDPPFELRSPGGHGHSLVAVPPDVLLVEDRRSQGTTSAPTR